jgi:hypothetical protein
MGLAPSIPIGVCLQADTTFRISKKFELMGLTFYSLHRKTNPVCLCITKREEAAAYGHLYSAMNCGAFDLVYNMKLRKQSKTCEM